MIYFANIFCSDETLFGFELQHEEYQMGFFVIFTWKYVFAVKYFVDLEKPHLLIMA